jgi:hypothetical protein
MSGGAAFVGYQHGRAIEKSELVSVENKKLEQDAKDHATNDKIANDAGRSFEQAKPIIVTQVRDRIREVRVPPDADPVLPVWFERMFDRLAAGNTVADAYPGEPDSAPSRLRLSGVQPVLTAWVIKYETCRKQVDDIRELNPVLPAPPKEGRGFLDIF